MKKRKKTASGASRTGRKKPEADYSFRLYVTGATARSTKAIRNLKELCEKHLPGRCDVEIVDIYQQPALAKDEHIIAAPTLVKQFPLPLRKFIGDLSNLDDLLVGMKIQK